MIDDLKVSGFEGDVRLRICHGGYLLDRARKRKGLGGLSRALRVHKIYCAAFSSAAAGAAAGAAAASAVGAA